MDNFSDWLVLQMDERGWKQADLARAANLDTAVISNVINNRRKAGEIVCRAIAKAFTVPPETVFRAAGLLPPKTSQNEKLDEALHLLSMLEGDDLEELIQIARLKLDRRKSPPTIKPHQSRRKPAQTVLKDNIEQ